MTRLPAARQSLLLTLSSPRCQPAHQDPHQHQGKTIWSSTMSRTLCQQRNPFGCQEGHTAPLEPARSLDPMAGWGWERLGESGWPPEVRDAPALATAGPSRCRGSVSPNPLDRSPLRKHSVQLCKQIEPRLIWSAAKSLGARQSQRRDLCELPAPRWWEAPEEPVGWEAWSHLHRAGCGKGTLPCPGSPGPGRVQGV